MAIALSVIFLAPFAFVLLTAFMTRHQALSTHLWPHPFQWANFKDVFHVLPLWRYGLNSFLYASLSTVGVVLSCAPGVLPRNLIKHATQRLRHSPLPQRKR